MFTLKGSDSKIPEGQEAYIKVSSTHANVLLSISSKDADFKGDDETQIIPGDEHRILESNVDDEMVYDFNERMPEMLISLINPDTSSRANSQIRFGIRNKNSRRIRWHSPVSCNEPNENYAWRWMVDLQLHDNFVSGGIYFHDCPGKGRAAYSVSGTIVNGRSPFVVSGSKFFDGGELAENTPSSQTFSLNYNASVNPNYTP